MSKDDVMNTDEKIINFRVQEDLIEMFDETCEFKNMNRTQILITLMKDFVEETVPEIQRWNTLYQMTGRRPVNPVYEEAMSVRKIQYKNRVTQNEA